MPSVNINPIYLGNCRSGQAVLAGASTQRSGTPTNPYPAFVADVTNGGMIETIRIVHSGPIGSAPTANNVIRAWRLNSGGSVYTLIEEFPLTATTPRATRPGPSSAPQVPASPTAGLVGNNNPALLRNYKLGKGESLVFTIHTDAGTQDQYNVDVTGGDFVVS